MKDDILPQAALVDLDGTIFEITPDWSMERNSAWELETMNAGVYATSVSYLQDLKQSGLVIVVLTARGQTCRPLTREKLKSHGLWEMVDHIHHRPQRWNNAPSALYKEAMIKRLGRKYSFMVAMEDEDKNLDVMRKAGIPVVIDAKRWHDGAIIPSVHRTMG
jgi:phosphoglycolate phosphatase-like HAD superfamily hydrolase